MISIDVQRKYNYISDFIELDCNLLTTFFGQVQTPPKAVGYITRLSFPAINQTLQKDLVILSPEDLNKQQVVAALDNIRWQGSAMDPLFICMRLSFQNRVQFLENLTQLEEREENAIFELEFVVFDYDWDTKTYFKRFYTDKKPLRLGMPDSSGSVYFDRSVSTHPEGLPTNFMFNLRLSPIEGLKDQEVNFSFSSTGKKFKRTLGTPNNERSN